MKFQSSSNFIEKETPTQMFSYKFYDDFKNTFFIEALGVTASKSSSKTVRKR